MKAFNQNEYNLTSLRSTLPWIIDLYFTKSYFEISDFIYSRHHFAFYPGEDELIQFEEAFYNTDLPNLEISNLGSDDCARTSELLRFIAPVIQDSSIPVLRTL
ncbi:hypothetical protein ACTFIW_000960 [Dictyostelium discoideum]